MILRFMAYGEYAPYSFANTKEESKNPRVPGTRDDREG